MTDRKVIHFAFLRFHSFSLMHTPATIEDGVHAGATSNNEPQWFQWHAAQWTCRYVCGSVEFPRGAHFQSSSYHRPVLVILQSSSSHRSFLFISKEVLTRKGMIRTAPDLDGMCIAVPHVVLYMPQHWWRATPWIRTTNKYNFETGYG